MEITCINCPQGCRMNVTLQNGEVVRVEGNNCKRGELYARQESIAPMRMVTAVIPLKNRKMPVSVKTKTPIPKEKIFDCMKVLAETTAQAPVVIGQVLVNNVCETGVDIIATRNID